MHYNFLRPATAALTLLGLSACVTTDIGDNILFSAPSFDPLIREAYAPQIAAYQEEIKTAREKNLPFDNELKSKEDVIRWFGPEGSHEGRAGVFMGILLDQSVGNFVFDINSGGETSTLELTKADYVKTNVSHDRLNAPYGPLDLLYVEKSDIDTPRNKRPLIVHCYGNGSNVYNGGAATALSLLLYGDVIQFDYPGFFGSTQQDLKDLRKLSNFEPMTDALAEYFNAQATNRPLIFWGHSLGGLVCANLAGKVPAADGLILETTGNDAETIAKAVVPAYIKPFIRLRVDPRLKQYRIDDMINGFGAPILVMGAKKDKTLSAALARKLDEALKEKGFDSQYKEFPNANHLSVKQDEALPDIIHEYFKAVNLRTKT